MARELVYWSHLFAIGPTTNYARSNITACFNATMSFSALLHRGLLKVTGRQQNETDNERGERQLQPYQVNTSKLSERLWDVFTRTYDLGVTAFGGPPVHFQIFHRRFVDGAGKVPWIDEQTVCDSYSSKHRAFV
jgi:hypothetical protein